jgi:hypothetical protein
MIENKSPKKEKMELNFLTKLFNKMYSIYLRGIVYHSFVILSITCLFALITCFVGLWFEPIPIFDGPVIGYLPKHTKISRNKLVNSELDSMIEAKSVYSINDMINYISKNSRNNTPNSSLLLNVRSKRYHLSSLNESKSFEFIRCNEPFLNGN